MNRWIACTSLVLALACYEDPVTLVGLTLTADTNSATLPRGQSTTLGLTTSRVGGYDATIRFAAENLPAGVSASFSPANLSGNENRSTLTLTAATTAAIGTSTIVIRAIGLAVDSRTVDVSLSVIDASGAGARATAP